MPLAAEAVPSLLYISLLVFLLIAGFGDSLLNVHTTVGLSTVVPIGIGGLLYTLTIFIPIVCRVCVMPTEAAGSHLRSSFFPRPHAPAVIQTQMNPTLRYSIQHRHVPGLYIRLEQVQTLTRNTKPLCRRYRFVTGGRFSMLLLVLLGNVFRGQTGSDTDEAVRKLASHPYISSLSVDLYTCWSRAQDVIDRVRRALSS